MRVNRRIRFEYATWKFLNSERKSCGFKNIRIRVDGVSVQCSQLLPQVSSSKIYSGRSKLQLTSK